MTRITVADAANDADRSDDAAGPDDPGDAVPTPGTLFGDTHPEDVAVPIVVHESEGDEPDAVPVTPARVAREDDALDLGATVLPVILKSYAPYLASGLIGLVIGWKIARRLPG